MDDLAMTCNDFVNAHKMLICYKKHTVSRANYGYTKKVIIIIIIIISLFAHSETMIVSIEHSKTHSMYKYNNYIQQLYITI